MSNYHVCRFFCSSSVLQVCEAIETFKINTLIKLMPKYIFHYSHILVSTSTAQGTAKKNYYHIDLTGHSNQEYE